MILVRVFRKVVYQVCYRCVTEDNVFPIIPLAMSPDSQMPSRSRDAVVINESTSPRFNDVSDQVKMMEDDSSESFNLDRYPKEMVLNSPRREVFTPVHGSTRHMDQTTLKAISQDVVSFRNLLQELQNVLQVDDNCENGSEEKTSQGLKMTVDGTNSSELEEHIFDLERQIVLMRQQLAEKDRTIKSLQERLASNTNSNQIALSPTNGVCINAATQTSTGDCGYVHSASIFNRHSPVDRLGSIHDDGLGPTVRSELPFDSLMQQDCENVLETAMNDPELVLNCHLSSPPILSKLKELHVTEMMEIPETNLTFASDVPN